MRQEPNNEIDLLLRRLARWEGSSIPEAGVHIGEQHLDADELSSYAANALPKAARARYTEHLAECSSCRKLVAQLSLSLGAVATEQISKASESSGLRKFLATLFSPMVLRYAVPAVGLIVVAAVGLIVLRRDAREGYVALVSEQDQSQPATSTSAQSPVPPSEDHAGYNEKAVAGAPAPLGRAAKAGEASPDTKVTADAKTAPPASLPGDVKEDAPAAAAELPTVVTAVPATRSPKFAGADDEVQRKAELEKKGQATVAEQSKSASEATKGREKEPAKEEDRTSNNQVAASSEGTAKAKPQPQDLSGAGLRGVDNIRSRAERRDKDATEIRSVAGRHFRKDGGVWTDTAYDSSQGTTNLTRGSEQYRALIADEPAIRTIAETLAGEIIVVWKGRTYRIR